MRTPLLAFCLAGLLACKGDKSATPPVVKTPPVTPAPVAPVAPIDAPAADAAVAAVAPAMPTVALAIVYAGQELVIGNDQVEAADSAALTPGILKTLEATFDTADFAHALPADSLGVAITYDDAARVVIPLGPAANLKSAALGTQKDYYSKVGSNLVAGIELARAELAKTNARKKILVIFGDGNDTNNETAKVALATLQTQLAAEHVQVHAVIYKSPISDAGNVVAVLDPAVLTVMSLAGLGDEFHRIFRECCHVPVVVANPPPLAVAVLFNGQETYVGNDALEPPASPAHHAGVLDALALALDKADFEHKVPLGSVGLVASYSDRVISRMPMALITGMRGKVLGTQKDYYQTIGSELALGIERTRELLEDTGATKKVMIVIGDGNDTNNDAAKARLSRLQGELTAAHVELRAIIVKGELSEAADVVSTLDPHAAKVAEAKDLPAAFAKVLAECCHR